MVKEIRLRLVSVRYRVNPERNVRSTTVELIVAEAFYDPNFLGESYGLLPQLPKTPNN